MLAAVLAFSSALVFGAADFLGGIASTRISALRVTAIAAVSGLVLASVAMPIVGGEWSADAVLFGALSGVSGAIAITLLYACLAIGPMSILSPLTGLVTAVVPMTVGILGGERMTAIGYAALALALAAVVLVGFVPERNAVRPTARGVVMAIGSGVGFGTILILLHLTPGDSGLAPIIVNRAVNAGLMFASVAVLAVIGRRRRLTTPTRGWRPGLVLAIACGFVDVVANTGILLGLRLGELSVVAVLTAMYPAGTIILAAIVLRERIAIVQYIGLALALTAAALFAVA